MSHPEEKIREVFIDFCNHQDKPKLPELWSITFPVDFRAASMMSTPHIQVWFAGFAQASKLGMWWSVDREDNVTLHSTTGQKPWIYELPEMILWIYAGVASLAEAEPGRVSSKNLTLLTKATEPYSY
jgi:hypothetical protein